MLIRLHNKKRYYDVLSYSDFFFRPHIKDLRTLFLIISLFVTVYQIILGTIENVDTADTEWVYRPYMNTTKKRKFLSDN